ncbi:MAG: T9SS type A sorting domain-containing protein [Flavobacteriales bacterium]|nr:T9SS type A sorting domain-containing protein [Flavobacteriales bacterium]
MNTFTFSRISFFLGVFTLLILGIPFSNYAQTFAIGEATFEWPDPDRNNRNVNIKAYYPATSAGASATPAAGTFPAVAFGHGFAMSYTAYQNVWEYYVPKGFIFLMVDMENGFSPVHEEFGKDILFTGKEFKNRSENNNGFLLYQKHNGRTALMGHSMGGGASVLGASFDPTFPDAVLGFASAETNPSAIAAASSVTAPFLMFAGSGDAVTPPANHQVPIYNALASPCKILVNITGGAHCYYANTDVACDFGELVSGGNITLDRAEQQEIVNSIMLPYLNVLLKDESSTTELSSALNQSGITSTVGCNLSVENAELESGFSIFPNPAFSQINIQYEITEISDITISLYNISGQQLAQTFIGKQTPGSYTVEQSLGNIKPGMYYYTLNINGAVVSKPLMVLR